MELHPAEVENLKRIVEEWILHDERELEATFSKASDTTSFLAVAQRLKAKGFTALPQEDRMNIITPEQVRFSVTGMSAIEKYCRDDDLESSPFEAMIKDRTGAENNLDIDEYNLRVKVRREIALAKNDPSVVDLMRRWPQQRKAFRILRRWTFMGEGLRFDLSMIRSTPKDMKGQFKWQTSFKQRDITKEEAFYEIEVELLRPSTEVTTEEERAALTSSTMKTLIRGVGEVLRGLQKHHILIRNSMAARVLQGYKDLVKTERFRGVAPITMVIENMQKNRAEKIPNIRDGYNVTDKADGLRMMGYVNGKGELFLLDMTLNVYRTGLKRTAVSNSLVDGEYVTRDKDNNSIQQYIAFDCYIAPDGKDVTQMPFAGASAAAAAAGQAAAGQAAAGQAGESRHASLVNWVTRWNDGDGPTIIPGAGVTEKGKILVSMKTFLFANAGDTTIFQACAKVLDAAKLYHTDGLILTPNLSPIPKNPGVGWKEQLKWKPSDENTVDFLCIFDKEPGTRTDTVTYGTMPGSGEIVQYKTMRLYVGSDLDPAYENPRGTILFEQPLPGTRGPTRGYSSKKVPYKPVLFNPTELPDTMAAVSYVKIESVPGSEEDYVKCESPSDDPIEDRSIVEMRYEAGNEPGWRWIPMRVRYDKTERYHKATKSGNYGGTMNKDAAAEGVWNSIHEPITRHMIRTGSEQPSTAEVKAMSGGVAAVASGEVTKVYYERKGPKEDLMIIRGLRDFHNRYIKEDILLGSGLRGGGKTLVDLACGQGGDVTKWIRERVDFVFGTDIAGEGIRDSQNGAYRRYLNQVMLYGGFDKIGKMIFTIGSSAKNLATGEAGATPEESNIMRLILGRVSPDGPVPPFVVNNASGRLRQGADCVAIMFAIHYFFENEMTLAGVMRNISDCLKIGGLFIGCCFDGDKVFDALRGISEGGSLVGQEGGAEVWKITKRYSATDLTNGVESVGMPIDVEFISIGTQQREYLVPFGLLKAKMAEIGCELLTKEECAGLGLVNSTALFEESFDMARKAKKDYQMSPTVRQYSFFNRWFIFKRRRGTTMDGDIAALASASSLVVPSVTKAEAAVDAAKTQLALAQSVSQAEPSAEAAVKDAESALTTATVALEKEGAAATASASSSSSGPVASGPAAPVAPALGQALHTLPVATEGRKYKLQELYQFYIGASQSDKLKIGDPDAARWLAPSAPFPIIDPTTKVEYPSLEHYLAGMKYKVATNKPELSTNIFSVTGTIHEESLRNRAVESAQGARALSAERDYELMKDERKKVIDESSPLFMKKYRATFDEGAWFAQKDAILAEGLRQRWERDARLRRIVEAVKAKGMILLYYTGPGSGSNLGGTRRPNETIDGENKVGRILMELAGFR